MVAWKSTQGTYDMNVENLQLIPATDVGEQTMVGFLDHSFPMPSGNCFSVLANGKYFNIVNFCAENWEEVQRRGVSLPITIAILDEKTAIVHDQRIPSDWYRNHWCECCCPEHLLPIQQRLRHDLERKQGVRVEHGNAVSIRPDLRPQLQ